MDYLEYLSRQYTICTVTMTWTGLLVP